MGTYSYSSTGSSLPHAVSSISGTVNGVVNSSYSYDANGNMTAGAGWIVAEQFSGSTSAMRYMVADHLDSTAVVTNESGNVVERDAYDAWGKRRNLNGTDDTCSLTSLTPRGFTGHEHTDSECLINANVRIYDPTIGRFMSADSEIPHPFIGQSFNRYSYMENNPLSDTDPTGMTMWTAAVMAAMTAATMTASRHGLLSCIPYCLGAFVMLSRHGAPETCSAIR